MRALFRLAATLPLAALSLAALVPVSEAQRGSDFMQEFKQAMGINATDEMQRLVKQNQDEAVLASMEICDLISTAPNDELETEIAALSKAYRAAFDSRFVLKQYEYFSLLSPQFKRTRKELIDRYLKQYDKFEQARGKDGGARMPAIGLEMQGLGTAFEEIGDLYMASMCYLYYGTCFDEEAMGEDADLRRACQGFEFTCEMRKKIELEDGVYVGSKERFDFLEFEGYGDPSKGPEARKAARAVADASFAPTPLEATFELLEDIDEIDRPRYTTDSIFQAWPKVYLTATGSKGTIPTLEQSPTILRLGANEAMVDIDGDGEGDVKIPLTGKISPVEVTLGQGDEQRKWAFLACIGAQDETVQGIRPYNLAPNKDQMQIFVAPASSIVGQIGETQIRIIDENMDGLYGGEPKGWAYIGLREGDFQWDIDSVVVGEEKRARPFSRYLEVEDQWYSLVPNEAGTDIIVAKDEIETGTIKLDLKGPKADYLILRGKGNNADIFVDIAPGGKQGTEVPVGSYDLFAGRISKGKKSQMMKALILPTRHTASWTVAAGGEATVELGAPFSFEFTMEQDEETVTVIGTTIVVSGRGHETYQRLWNCVPQAEVLVRRVGSKKGKKEKKIRQAGTQDEVNEMGEVFVWFPVAFPIEKKKSGEAVEVQLFEKKNKLFGKIESEWKES